MSERGRKVDTVADRWSPSRNSFGLLRHIAVFGVLVAHCWPLGFGLPSPGDDITRHQTDLGTLSLFALLFVAGFLNTESGLRFPAREFTWRRCVRIFPGLWVCLVVTAFVFAPIAARYENGNLEGFWNHPQGPVSYVTTNVAASMEQYPISGLLAGTPYGQAGGGPSAFDGSLWTLRYEFACYVLLGVFIATAVLRRWRPVVLAFLAVGWALMWVDVITDGPFTRGVSRGAIGPIPLFGSFAYQWVLYLGFLFLIGAAMRLYPDRVPMHRWAAVAAGAIVLLTMRVGFFTVIGLPAYAYLLMFAVVSLPGRFTTIGRRRDYSYGIFIYAYPVQQLTVLMGAAAFGMFPYLAICTVLTVLLAAASWHLIEGPSQRLKDRFVNRRAGPALEAAT